MSSFPPGTASAPDALLLVVNDDEPTRYLLARMLRKGGFRVLEAKDGAEALEATARERPDLVVLDVRLPGVSGYEIGRELRAAPTTASVGIVYASACFPPEVVRLEAPAVGDAYVGLPVDEAELLTTVRLVLETRQTVKAGPGP